jgi:exodeoxyribonuclease III
VAIQGTALEMWVFRRTCYHLATPALAQLARSESIYKAEKFSDHAPITVEYELSL